MPPKFYIRSLLNKKLFLLILIPFFMASCTNGRKSPYFISKIRKELKRNYSITHGEIAAKFDLESINKEKKLFASNYGKIINEEKYNTEFLSNFAKNYRIKNNIENNAILKTKSLSSLLISLDKKYKILTNAEKRAIIKATKTTNCHTKTSRLKILANLHNATKTIPIYVPLYKPHITSKFGPRRTNLNKKARFHYGLDLAGRKNCDIYSAGDGVVQEVARANGYGNLVLIKHGNDIKTRYAHLNKIYVKQGDKIILGQKLGTQGVSGTVSGAHLHFEVIIGKKAVNPMDFIASSL